MTTDVRTRPIPSQYDWNHPDPLTRAFEMVDGTSVEGSLRFTNLVGSRAHGTAFGDTWDFRRIGIFRPRVEIRATGTSEESAPDATIALDFAGTGALERTGMPAVQWAVTSTTAWGWVADGVALVRFEHRPADDGIVATLVQAHGRATITPPGATRSDLPLLLVAGWYLMAAQQFDLVANPPSF